MTSLIKIKYSTLLIISIFFTSITFGQTEFSFDAIYFEQQSFDKIKVSEYGDIWCQKTGENNKLYSIKTDWTLHDHSTKLSPSINTEITDFAPVAFGVVIGTKGQGIFYFNDNNLQHIDISVNGETKKVKDVFSITYPYKSKVSSTFSVCADSLIYQFEIDNNNKINTDQPNISQGKYKALRKSAYSIELQGKNRFRLSYINSRGYYGLNSSNFPDTIAEPTDLYFYDSGSWYWWIGTKKGLYFRYSSWIREVYLPNDCINEIINYNGHDYDRSLLIASSSGLYTQVINGKEKPVKIDLGHNITAVNDMVWAGNTLLLATNNGIVRMTHKACKGQSQDVKATQDYTNFAITNEQQFYTKHWFQWDTYLWKFSDATTSNKVNPTKNITSTGYLSVSHSASNKHCQNNIEKKHPVFSSNETINDNYKKTKVKGYNDVYREIQCLALGNFNDDYTPDFYFGKGNWREDVGFWAINKSTLTYDDLSGPFLSSTHKTPQKITSADFNNDGKDELIISGKEYGLLASLTKQSVKTIKLDQLKGFSKLQSVDINNDGLNDIIGINHLSQLNIFTNKGQFSFSSTTINTSITAKNFCWVDFNLDGYLDLATINDNSLCMYTNHNGALTKFKHFNNAGGTHIRHGDLNNDGYPDFVYANQEQFSILKSDIKGNYEFIDFNFLTNSNNDKYRSVMTSFDLADMNNDGRLDIVYLGSMEAKLYYNMGNMVFYNQSYNLNRNFNEGTPSRLALTDLDLNGTIDILALRYSKPLFLTKESSSNNWLEFKLHGVRSNTNAFGSRIDLFTTKDGKVLKQSRQITNNHQNDMIMPNLVHFGLGSVSSVDSVKVFWPSGIKRTYKKITSNQLIDLVEPGWPNIKSIICSNVPTKIQLPKLNSYKYELIHNSDQVQNVLNSELLLSKEGKYQLTLSHPLGKDICPVVHWTVVHPSKAKIATPDKSLLCPNDSMMLNASGGKAYNWLKNEVTLSQIGNSINIKTPGKFQAISIDNNGCRDTSAIMEILPKEGPKFHLAPDTSICAGNSIVLSVDDATVTWNNQLPNDTLKIPTTGSHQATIIKSNGCIEKKSINIKLLPLPNFRFESDTVRSCNRTYIQLTSNNLYNIDRFKWSDGITTYGTYRSVYSAGKYITEAIGENGCRSTDSVYIDLPQWPSKLFNDTVLTKNTTLTYKVPDKYSAVWWNGSIDNSVSINSSDIKSPRLYVQITDSNYCNKYYYFNIFKNHTSINKTQLKEYFTISQYNNTLHLLPKQSFTDNNVDISIYSINGQYLSRSKHICITNQPILIPLNSFARGIYLLFIEFDKNNIASYKFKIQ